MLCENNYCIYQKENKCRLENITIDVLGKCADCTPIILDDDFLETEKDKQMVKMEKIKNKMYDALNKHK